MSLAVVALGGNLGDRLGNLSQAGQALHALGLPLSWSQLYETAPLGPPQPDYLNGVVLLDTGLPPHVLLHELIRIEEKMGRLRGEKWGPRTIDLDLISYGEAKIDDDELRLPHPQAHRRAFVLVPLLEVIPELVLVNGQTVRELTDALSDAERSLVRPFKSHDWLDVR